LCLDNVRTIVLIAVFGVIGVIGLISLIACIFIKCCTDDEPDAEEFEAVKLEAVDA